MANAFGNVGAVILLAPFHFAEAETCSLGARRVAASCLGWMVNHDPPPHPGPIQMAHRHPPSLVRPQATRPAARAREGAAAQKRSRRQALRPIAHHGASANRLEQPETHPIKNEERGTG
jgi:hypothetical protein